VPGASEAGESSGENYEDKLDLIRNTDRHLPQRGAEVRHVHRTLVGAIGIAEEQERDVSTRSLPEIKMSARGVGKNEPGFWQGRRH
jgi:hypothetical protein